MSGRPGLTLLGRHTTMQPPENEKKRLLLRILWHISHLRLSFTV
jgi:hypothetical protein